MKEVQSILGYNSWLFNNAVEGVTQEQSGFRLNEKTNSFDRIAGHLAVGRATMAGLLEMLVAKASWGEFAEFGADHQFSGQECPVLADIVAYFNSTGEAIILPMPEVPDAIWDRPALFPLPGKPTMREQIAWMTMHESYHIGQLGILRKSLDGGRIMDAS